MTTPTPAAPTHAAQPLRFDGVLFFPVTPFTATGLVDLELLAEHVASRLPYEPGAVFPGCGTGEFHALTVDEIETVVARTVDVVDGRVPVIAGAGGQLGHALQCALGAQRAGADGILLLPPYLVSGTTEGLIAYVETVAVATQLPIILYHRGAAQYTVAAIERLVRNPRIVGFKDGVGDVALTQSIVRAVAAFGRGDVQFFNGLLTAELSQAAYRGIGVPLYSSAAFAMAPDVATAHYRAYVGGDETARVRLLDAFYTPLVQLRDEVPGFGVSLVKAGLRMQGLAVGSVRPPLVDPSARQLDRLGEILAAGRDAAGAHPGAAAGRVVAAV